MRPLFAALLSLALAGPAAGQELIAADTAPRGREDLYNFRGQRLTAPWQSLRQDRANSHRFGIRQLAAEGDPVLASADARAQMAALIRAGLITPEARRAILCGDRIVHVEVYGRG